MTPDPTRCRNRDCLETKQACDEWPARCCNYCDHPTPDPEARAVRIRPDEGAGSTYDHTDTSRAVRGDGQVPLGQQHEGVVQPRTGPFDTTHGSVPPPGRHDDAAVVDRHGSDSALPLTTPEARAVRIRAAIDAEEQQARTTTTPWRFGDVGRIQRCVKGGDPYWITVSWLHAERGWVNVGTGLLLPDQPRDEDVQLLVRNDEPVPDLRDLAADRQTLDDCLTALREHYDWNGLGSVCGDTHHDKRLMTGTWPCPTAVRALALLDRLDARYPTGDSA